jgi:hypothetical protein
VLQGLQPRAAWSWGAKGGRVKVVAAETSGAGSFAGAWAPRLAQRPRGRAAAPPADRAFRLAGIDSIATSLGALQVQVFS